jgi:ribonuclease HI
MARDASRSRWQRGPGAEATADRYSITSGKTEERRSAVSGAAPALRPASRSIFRLLLWLHRICSDGSCNAEGVAGRGGWAALIERDGSTERLVGSALETTQNRMELTAVCEALERVDGAIEVRTDSKYIEKCFSEGWHIRWRRDDKWRTPKGPVKNRDLWERLFALVEDDARDVAFVWVKGHRDQANNNIVDRLSRAASKSHAEH